MRRVMFYLANLTWGLILNVIGFLTALVFIGDGCDPKIYRGCVCIEAEEGWGGLSLGLFIFCEEGASERLKSHEFGHAVQNCIFGPLMVPLVLCSAARYHDRNRRAQRGETLPSYDSWWFEGQATQIGEKITL